MTKLNKDPCRILIGCYVIYQDTMRIFLPLREVISNIFLGPKVNTGRNVSRRERARQGNCNGLSYHTRMFLWLCIHIFTSIYVRITIIH